MHAARLLAKGFSRLGALWFLSFNWFSFVFIVFVLHLDCLTCFGMFLAGLGDVHGDMLRRCFKTAEKTTLRPECMANKDCFILFRGFYNQVLPAS